MILVAIRAEVNGFDRLRDEHESYPDFKKIYVALQDGSVREIGEILLQDGYLFRFCKLCIPCTSIRDLSWEVHAGGLVGHFGQNKTIEAVEHRFYWPSLRKDVARSLASAARVN